MYLEASSKRIHEVKSVTGYWAKKPSSPKELINKGE